MASSPSTSTHRIPILGRISAGLPLYAEEHIEGYTLTDLNGGAEYFGLRVSGDSMNALRINEGDIIIVRGFQITIDSFHAAFQRGLTGFQALHPAVHLLQQGDQHRERRKGLQTLARL